jgi:hypothetical protein
MFFFKMNLQDVYGENPASLEDGANALRFALPGQEQLFGCATGKTRTRPSLQMVKSPCSPFGYWITISGLVSGGRARVSAEHPHSEDVPTAAISKMRKLDMGI